MARLHYAHCDQPGISRRALARDWAYCDEIAELQMVLNVDLAAGLDRFGFVEGSNAKPGHYVIERAFVG
jgi:hypothetical protein